MVMKTHVKGFEIQRQPNLNADKGQVECWHVYKDGQYLGRIAKMWIFPRNGYTFKVTFWYYWYELRFGHRFINKTAVFNTRTDVVVGLARSRKVGP